MPSWQRYFMSSNMHGLCPDQATKKGARLEGQRDALLAAVLHELELAVGRHEAHHLLRVEAAQIHALVQRHVLDTSSAATLLGQPQGPISQEPICKMGTLRNDGNAH